MEPPEQDKPLADQVLEELFSNLAKRPDFPPSLLAQLRQLAATQKFSKPADIVKLLKTE